MNLSKGFFLIALSCLSCFSAWSQDRSKFGKVTRNELEMEYYELDSTANAVILFDYGKFDNRNYQFTRHVRLKILKKEGLNRANWTLHVPSKSNFKGVTSNLNEAGEIVQEKLDNKSVYSEEYLKGRLRYKVLFTGVKEGSVIDLKYSFIGMPYQWRFQDLIPVKYSELEITRSPYIEFNQRFYGFIQVPQVETDHWIVKNVPAFVSEPLSPHYSNYISKFEFEISKISFPNYYDELATTWEAVSSELLEYDYFGGAIRGASFLSAKGKELRDSEKSIEEKIYEAYYFIKENIKGNGRESITVSSSYASNFKDKHQGSTAEVNLALLALLDKAKIKAWPVVLSTRDNGLLTPFYPSLNKLNYVVACVKLGDRMILLDASMDDLAPGILPEKCMNGSGWLVDRDHGEWIDLDAGKSASMSVFANISKNESDEWSAGIVCTNKNYDYLSWKKKISSYSSVDDYARTLEEQHPTWFLEDYQVVKDDSVKSTSREKIIVDITEDISDHGVKKIIYPIIINPFKNNPFKSKERKYPIDFSTQKDISLMITLKVPEGYSVENLPSPEKIYLGEKSIEFSYLVSEQFGNVQLRVDYHLNQVIFTEMDYENLQTFYSKILQIVDQPVVLVKNT
ncbi:hypothetical protein [Reichenbachiella sp.]|uniref:hypothetical protein n=1 Tax=Reichenbachiella sp. TaxID=2184521 RepID=UPI003B5A8E62